MKLTQSLSVSINSKSEVQTSTNRCYPFGFKLQLIILIAGVLANTRERVVRQLKHHINRSCFSGF